jgi:serine phosphatase RsbU (regulator of sigma subunit)
MAGELQAAREIQMGMLPDPRAIDSLPSNLEFHAFLEPAAEVGGDFYDAFMLDEYRFFFLIGDVAGKGVPASLFMALSKTLCKSIVLREHSGLEEWIILTNEALSRENPATLFITLLTGLIDVRTGVMELCNAGHEAPILLRLGEAPCCLDTVGGPPLCVLEDFHYTASRIQLQSYDTLVLITDGVTEAQDADQNLYGLPRALAYFAAMHTDENAPRLSVKSVCQGLYGDVKHFASGTPATDDITIMAVRFARSYTSTPVA